MALSLKTSYYDHQAILCNLHAVFLLQLQEEEAQIIDKSWKTFISTFFFFKYKEVSTENIINETIFVK